MFVADGSAVAFGIVAEPDELGGNGKAYGLLITGDRGIQPAEV